MRKWLYLCCGTQICIGATTVSTVIANSVTVSCAFYGRVDTDTVLSLNEMNEVFIFGKRRDSEALWPCLHFTETNLFR